MTASAHEMVKALVAALEKTKSTELDCDAFAELLPEYVESGIECSELLALVEAHREICAECDEEFEILKRAVEGAK